MAKKTSNLKIVQQQTLSEAELQAKAERKKKWSEEFDRWDKAENELLVSGRQARQRVQVLRDELESAQNGFQAVHGFCSGDPDS